MRLVNAMISADKANISLPFKRAFTWDSSRVNLARLMKKARVSGDSLFGTAMHRLLTITGPES